MAQADFNSDGIPDVAVCCFDAPQQQSGLAILLGNGDGTYRPALTTPLPQKPFTVAVADFNKDGKPDIATSGWLDGGVVVPLNDSSVQPPRAQALP